MDELKAQLKELIIKSLDLEEVTADEIEDEAPLFGDGLGLDSIDALEIGVQIQKKYNIAIDSDPEKNKVHFASINGLAQFITSHQNQ